MHAVIVQFSVAISFGNFSEIDSEGLGGSLTGSRLLHVHAYG